MAEIAQEELNPAAGAEPVEKPAVSETAAEETEQANKGKGWQKRVDRLTRRNYEQDQRIERLLESQEQLISRLAGKSAAPEAKAPVVAEKPTPDKFATYEEYVEALADYKAEQKIDAKLASHKERQEKSSEQQQLKETFDAYNHRVAEAQSRYDDFDEVVGRSDIQVPQAVQMAVIELDNGPDVAYYLGQHPEICEELCAKRPMAAVAMLGRIAATLEVEAEDETENESEPGEKPAPKPAVVAAKPAAPAPIRPLRKPAPASTGLSDDLPWAEWNKRRQAQVRKK